MTQPPTELDGPPATRPVRLLAGAAAVLAVVYFLLGFLGGVGVSDLAGVFVVGGGLLVGTVALPKAGRVLAPATVAVTLGLLMLLQTVMTSRITLLLIAALVVAFAEMVAAIGALMVDVGTAVRTPAAAEPFAATAGHGSGALDPATNDGSGAADPTTASAWPPGAPDAGAPIAAVSEPAAPTPSSEALSSDVIACGPSGAVPMYGLSIPPDSATERATETVARFESATADDEALAGGPFATGAAHGSGDAAAPRFGRSPSSGPGAWGSNGAVNGSAAPFGPDRPTTAHPTMNGSTRGGPSAPGSPPFAEPGPRGGTNGFDRTHGSSSAVPTGGPGAANGSVFGLSPGSTSSPGGAAAPNGYGGPHVADPKPPVNGHSPTGSHAPPFPGPSRSGSGRGPNGESPSPRVRSGPGSSAAMQSLSSPVPSDIADASAPGNSTLPVHAPSGVGPHPSSQNPAAGPNSSGATGGHRAPTPEQDRPAPGASGTERSGSRSGAHRAPTTKMSPFGPPEPDGVGAVAPAPRRADTDESALPRRRSSLSDGSGGQHLPSSFRPFEDLDPAVGPASSGRFGDGPQAGGDRGRPASAFELFQPAPHGSSSHPGLPPAGSAAERRFAPPDPVPDTTSFRAQSARGGSAATPAWGHNAFDGPEEREW